MGDGSTTARRITAAGGTLTLLSLVFASGCDDGVTTGTAEVSLALTDAAGEVASVWISIREIYLQGDDAAGRVTLLAPADAAGLGLMELTSLAGTTLDLVSGVEVPAGSYGQLRFVVDGAVLETDDGGVYTLDADHPDGLAATGALGCPSCVQTGIKVVFPEEVVDLEAGAHLIVLDFDVAQSFGHPAGQSGFWEMHPVIVGEETAITVAQSSIP